MTTDRGRNSKGQYVATHDVTSRDVFETMDPLEPYTTRELADALAMPRRSAYEHLEELADAGKIRKKKPEPRRAIWIRPEDTTT